MHITDFHAHFSCQSLFSWIAIGSLMQDEQEKTILKKSSHLKFEKYSRLDFLKILIVSVMSNKRSSGLLCM